jgi:hypothetical protein
MQKRDDPDELLDYIAAGAAVLFAVTVAIVVVIQTAAPLFGLEPGAPSDVTIGTMIAAVITLSTSLGIRIVKRTVGGKGQEDSDGGSTDDGV